MYRQECVQNLFVKKSLATLLWLFLVIYSKPTLGTRVQCLQEEILNVSCI